MSAAHPGGFGNPAEDCNCRCAMMPRARWALGEDELSVLKERAEHFGLDKTKDFEDFKEKYLQATKKSGKVNTALKVNTQLFAKDSKDYKTVSLSYREYAHVMSEIATNLTKEQSNKKIFSKHIGNYTYTVENNGFGNYRVISKRKIREAKRGKKWI